METTHKYATGYCSCGITFDTRRSQAAKYEDAIEIVKRSVRRHIANPEEFDHKLKEKHSVTLIESRVTIIT